MIPVWLSWPGRQCSARALARAPTWVLTLTFFIKHLFESEFRTPAGCALACFETEGCVSFDLIMKITTFVNYKVLRKRVLDSRHLLTPLDMDGV